MHAPAPIHIVQHNVSSPYRKHLLDSYKCAQCGWVVNILANKTERILYTRYSSYCCCIPYLLVLRTDWWRRAAMQISKTDVSTLSLPLHWLQFNLHLFVYPIFNLFLQNTSEAFAVSQCLFIIVVVKLQRAYYHHHQNRCRIV